MRKRRFKENRPREGWEARVLGEAERKRRKERTGGRSSERLREEAQQDGGMGREKMDGQRAAREGAEAAEPQQVNLM